MAGWLLAAQWWSGLIHTSAPHQSCTKTWKHSQSDSENLSGVAKKTPQTIHYLTASFPTIYFLWKSEEHKNKWLEFGGNALISWMPTAVKQGEGSNSSESTFLTPTHPQTEPTAKSFLSRNTCIVLISSSGPHLPGLQTIIKIYNAGLRIHLLQKIPKMFR